MTRVGSSSPLFSKYGALIDIALRVTDLLVVASGAVISWVLRFGGGPVPRQYFAGLAVILLLTLLIFQACGVYHSWRGERLPNEVLRLWLAWTAVFLAFIALQWMFKASADYSRLWLGTWFVSAAVLFVLNRWMARGVLGALRRRGIDTRSVVVVGATNAALDVIRVVRESPWTGLDITGYVSTPYDQVAIGDVPCLGSAEDYFARAGSEPPDQLWLALPLRAEALIRSCMEAFEAMPTRLRLVPDFFGYELLSHQVAELGGVPVLTLRGTPFEGRAHLVKALEDRILSLLLLVLLSPLLLLIALGVKLSSAGPVFFRQCRHGLDAKEIYVLKFRTMRLHREPPGQVRQAMPDDPRVTGFGRFLRRTSLDELPQLINVLRGEMSIVGPRPHAVEHNQYYSQKLRGYMQRHGVKPGMTGWAQVNGLRGETDTVEKMAKRIEHDIYYINNWSFWLDLKIILMTPLAILARTNAY